MEGHVLTNIETGLNPVKIDNTKIYSNKGEKVDGNLGILCL